MFDLSQLAAKDTFTLQLRHPATDELLADKDGPVEVVIFGQSSKEYRNAVNAMQDRALKRGNKKLSAERMREENIELLVACTDKFNNLSLKGKPVSTVDDIRAVYSDDTYGWIRSQVDEAITDASNFLEQ